MKILEAYFLHRIYRCKPRKKAKSFFLTAIVLLVLSPMISVAQNNNITGQITDESGVGVPDVSVMVKGTTIGTTSDANGRYNISVPSNGELVFSSVGYVTREVSVDGQTTINIVLSKESTNLEQVIVIGYGTQRREAVTGSVASISGNSLRDVPTGNVTQALQGRISGVQIEQTSSKPGSTMQIRIRGTRSISADNNPLIVLDGIPFSGTLADISSDDIKSIDILKDASATAIYGSRGANGVILISTNRGNMGQKPQFSYNTYYGFKKAIKYPMMNAKEYLSLRETAGLNTNPGSDEDITGAVDIDWQDLWYKTGQVQNHDLSVSGGTQNGSYNFGVGYYNDVAPVPNSKYDRFSIRGSIDQKIGKLLQVGFTTNNNYSITDGDLGMYGVLSMTPIANPFNDDGSIKRTITMPQDVQWVYTKESVGALGDKYVNRTKSFASYNSIYGELGIPGITGLKLRVNLGANVRTSNSGSYTGIGVFSSTADNPNTASVGNSITTQWTNENMLIYDRTFADKHQVNVVALYSAEQTSSNSSSISRKNIPGDNFQYFNLGQTSTGDNDDITINPSNQGYQMSGLMSAMGRVMYGYDNRYMISATFRSDGSSRLASGHKWHSYPAVSVGWNIGNETFAGNLDWLNSMKLRLGWGQTSNQAVAPYSTLGLLSTRPYNFGTENAVGYYVSTLPNPSLGWEFSNTKNIGLDFSILKNRISGTFEYYVTDTKDLLLQVNLPSTSGVGGYTGNVGATQNKGFELSLNGAIIENQNGWNWDFGFNIYSNKNKIVQLASGQLRDETNWLFVGYPLNVIYDYKKIGIWQESEADIVKLYEGDKGQPGLIKVMYTGDFHTDGTPSRVIGSDDRQIIKADPDFLGGFNTRVSYKDVGLTIVGTFQNGGILNSTLYGANGYLNLEDGRRGQIKIDYWTEDNPNAKYPDPNGPKSSNNPYYGSTLGLFDASYLKIRTMTLDYSFASQPWTKAAGISNVRVYFTVQNPFVFFSPYHKESGMDPETNSYANDGGNMAVPYSSNLSRLLTVGYNTPNTRNYMLGLNITF